MALDSFGNPHVVWSRNTTSCPGCPPGNLRFASKPDSTCAWEVLQPDSIDTNHNSGRVAVALDTRDSPYVARHIVYTSFDEDFTTGQLWYAMTSTVSSAPPLPATALYLSPNRPNPFNPKTVLTYVLPQREHVRLTIHDMKGRLVATLVDDLRDGGPHSVTWTGHDRRGTPVASGVYFARLQALGEMRHEKMILLK